MVTITGITGHDTGLSGHDAGIGGHDQPEYPHFLPAAIFLGGCGVGVVAGTAMCTWSNSAPFGSTAEWAGAIATTITAMVAIGIAFWSQEKESRESTILGAFEIVAGKHVISRATVDIDAMINDVRLYIGSCNVADDVLQNKIIVRNRVWALGGGYRIDAIPLTPQQIATSKEVEIAAEALENAKSGYGAFSEPLGRVSERLNAISHFKAAAFSGPFARSLVEAKSQLALCATFAQDSGLRHHLLGGLEHVNQKLSDTRGEDQRAERFIQDL